MSEEKTFIVETSAHHIHVTQETLEELFGEGATLGVRKMLSQPGQFASDKRLNIVYHAKITDRVTGDVKEKAITHMAKDTYTQEDIAIENMSILGPVRKENQVEISMTEARTLKAVVPVRESGDLAGSCPVTLVNPLNGKSVDCKEGMIIAKRHIHMTPADAENFGVKNGDIVAVKIVSSNGRSAILGDTVIRVSDKYALAMHIDTDESNAVGGAASGVVGSIVKVEF